MLSNIVYSLLAHPDAHKRLQTEIDAFYPPDADALDPAHLGKMHFLEAVMCVLSHGMT